MTNSVLTKTNLKGSIAESILNDISNKSNRYYYFLGRTQPWSLDYAPYVANDSYKNELVTRGDIIYAKQISSSDVSLVVPRANWTVNTVYDRYDDEYSTEIVGVNLTSGGAGYTSAPTVTLGGTGSGATATATYSSVTGQVTGITMTTRGSGYLNSVSTPPTATLTGGGGTGATAVPVLVNGQGNTTRLEDTNFYVLTNDYNVYICIDNNQNGISTVQPYGTASTPVTLSDGYIWKYLYTLPLALRSKFLTVSYMPIANSLHAQFYSAGGIQNVQINANGSGYTTLTKIVSAGDGFLAADPYYVTASTITTAGAGYTAATLTFDPPAGGTLASTAWASARVYIQGQYVSYLQNVYIIDVAGTSNGTPPTHTTGSVLNGASFKYVGTSAQANATVTSGAISAVTLLQGVRDVNITNGGTGYANGPNAVTFSSGSATAVAYAQNGVIYRIDITNRALNSYTTLPTITAVAGGGTGFAGTVLGASGAGYTTQPNVTVTGTGTITTVGVITPTMVKSEARIFPVITGGSIVGTVIADGGVGYSAVTLTVSGNGTGAQVAANILTGDATTLQSNTELTAIDGTLYTIPIVSGGYGYTTVPSVVIHGDGTGASATATIANGAVTGVVVTAPGSGYKKVTIDFIGGGGAGASARAIIPPYGGHSKNVVRGLGTHNLMLYTNVSKDQINGYNLGADYRQFGLIRSPYTYGTPTFTAATIVTACWTVTPTTTVPVSFVADAIATVVPITGGINTTVSAVTSGTVFNVASVTGIAIGMSLAGTGVVVGTTVTAISGSQITVSNPVAGITTGFSYRFNYISSYRVVYATTAVVIFQSMNNSVPIIGEIFNYGGNTFTAATVTSPSFDKYSGDLLYQDNQVPFTPVDNSSEKITISTVLTF